MDLNKIKMRLKEKSDIKKISFILLLSLAFFCIAYTSALYLTRSDINELDKDSRTLFKINSRVQQITQDMQNTYNTPRCIIIRQDGNETFFDVMCNPTDDGKLEINFTLNNSKIVKYKEDKADFIYVPKSQMKLDLNKKEVINVTRELSNGQYNYNYIINPEEVSYVKFGDNSIEILIDRKSISVSYGNNTVNQPNFTHITIQPIEPYDRLLSYWTFDADSLNQNRTAYDFHDRMADLTYQGGAVINESGLYGSAVQLDGGGDNLFFNGIIIQNVTNFTFSFWAYPVQAVTGGARALIVQQRTGTNYGYIIRQESSNRIQFCGSSCHVTNWNQYNSWSHIVAVANDTDMTIYINGTQVFNGVRYWLASAPDNGFYIGKTPGGDPNTEFNGSIDDVMVFNTALNSSQVLDIFNNQSRRYYPSAIAEFVNFNVSLDIADTLNVTINQSQALFGSSIDMRIGQWTKSFDYNLSDLNASLNGLIGYWNIDNATNGEDETTLVDRTGHFNLSRTGGAPNGYKHDSGRYGGAVHIDGVNEAYQTSANGGGVYNFSINDSFSLVAWIYTQEKLNEGQEKGIIGRYTGSPGSGYYYFTIDGTDGGGATGKLEFRMAGNNNTLLINQVGNTTVQNFTWTHAAVTFNGSKVILYKDGAIESGGNIATNAVNINSSVAFQIGSAGSTAFTFNGSIDEAMVFNRSLTPDEVKELYVKGRALWNYTGYSNLNGSFAQFNISNLSTHFLPSFKMNASPNNHYTPIIAGSTSYIFYNLTGEPAPPDNTPPDINFLHPTNTTYNSVQTAINYTVGDAQVCWYSSNAGATNTTITCGNNVTGLNSGQGSSIWLVAANDTSNNVNSSTITLFVDSIFPLISFVSPNTPSNATNITHSNASLSINVSITETNIGNITYELYNDTNGITLINRTIFTSNIKFINFTNLIPDTYYYNVTIYDVANNKNITGTRTYIVNTPDTQSPQFSSLTETPSDPATYSSGATYQFNSTWTDDAGINNVQIEFNGVNYTSTNPNGNFYNFTIRDLGAGTYNYYWHATDTTGNRNITSTQTYTVSKTTNTATLLINGTAGNQTATYLVQTNASGRGVTGAITLYRNNVDVTAQNNIYITLGVGNYNYTVVTLDNQNYTSQTLTRWSHITINSTLCTISTNSPVTYPTQVSVTGTCSNPEATGKLFRNNTEVSSPYNAILGVGFWNFSANVTATQNYSSSATSTIFTINKNSTLFLSLALSPSASVTYPTETTATGSGCPTELSCSLARGATGVSNPDVQTLGVASYIYNYSTSGNLNYTATSTASTLTLNQGVGVVYTYIDHLRSDKSVNNGSTVALNGTLIAGNGTITLYINDSSWNTGASPLYNSSVFTVGTYVINNTYLGNTNWTGASEIWTLSVSLAAAALSGNCNSTTTLTYAKRPYGVLCHTVIRGGRIFGGLDSLVTRT